LIRASVLLGAQCGTLSGATATALDHYAKCIGLASRWLTTCSMPKPPPPRWARTPAGPANNKPTYVSLLGVTRARELALELRPTPMPHGPSWRARRAAAQLADFVVERTF